MPPTSEETTLLEYKLAGWLIVYLCPVILLVGTVGNGLSLAVLRSNAFCNSSVGFTLSALAIVDTSVLYTTMLRLWLLNLTDWTLDVRVLLGSTGCKIHLLLTYYLSQLSSWTLVVLTVERTLGICVPLKAKIIFTKRRVMLMWFTVAGALLFVNSHFMWTASYDFPPNQNNSTSNSTSDSEKICFVGPAYYFFFFEIWYWLDYTLLSAFPFLIILTGNVVIISRLVRSSRLRQETLMMYPTATPNTPFSPCIPKTPFSPSNIAPRFSSIPRMPSSTAMLIGVSTLFLLLTTPSAVYFLIYALYDEDADDAETQAKARLAFAITNLLYYMNNATNFILYCFVGTRFRRALSKQLFRWRSKSTLLESDKY